MTIQTREGAKKRTEMLLFLRSLYPDNVKRAQILLKEQQAIRKELRQAMQSGPQTVPQLAAATGIEASQVLWHLTAMKKYGLVEETGMDQDEAYYLYALSKESKT